MEPHMPLDLIIQILCQLPVKSLIRFTCVCKQWGLEIKDKNFIKLQLQKSPETDIGLVAYNYQDGMFLSMDLNSMVIREELMPEYRLMGTCNGLICLYSWDNKSASASDESIILWNMSTGERLVLPEAPNINRIPYPTDTLIGLGYDSINDDYKVIKIVMFSPVVKFHYATFYSLRSKSWVKIKKRNSYLLHQPLRGVYASGSVHWRASDQTNMISLAYNINTEEQQILQLPSDMLRWNTPEFADLGGDFCVLYHRKYEYLLDIWVMKEYGVKESWTRLYTVHTCDIFYLNACCLNNKNGDNEVLVVTYDDLYDNLSLCYNNLKSKIKSCRHVTDAQFDYTHIYRRSLVRILD